ncbi:flagellar hook-associated protein 3, partial [Vibrio fluvialis]|nr:flagellar hook-associated protein 3 [Vibrio fluvialis]
RERVLWGANGTMTTDDREGIVTELKSLRDSIASSFNAQDEEGHFLFSGTATSTAALDNSGGSYVLQGNSDKRVVTVAKGVTMESNMTAQDILDLGGGSNVLNTLDALISEFEAPTANFRTEVDNTLAAVDSTLNN